MFFPRLGPDARDCYSFKKKTVIMPRGQFPKLKGVIAKMPADVSDMTKKLACTDALILMKLTKNSLLKSTFILNQFRDPCYNCPPVFKRKFKLSRYYDITIDLPEVTNDFLTFTDEPIEFTVGYSKKKPENLKDDETTYPLGGYRQP